MALIRLSAIVLLLASCAAPALSQAECAEGVTTCLNTFMASLQAQITNPDSMCGILETYINCVFSLDCPLTEQERQNLVQETSSRLSDQGINCDIGGGGTGTGTGTGTGSGTGSGTGTGTGSGTGTGTGTGTGPGTGTGGADEFVQVVLLFGKHNCMQVPSECSVGINTVGDESHDAFCGKVKTSGKCMFSKCPDIKDTQDGEMAAELLVKFAKNSFNCQNIEASELSSGNGQGANVYRSIWSTIGLVSVAFLFRKILI